MNDTDREQWVNNDEDLYSWYKSTTLSMRDFLRINRADLDECIKWRLDGRPEGNEQDG